MTRRAATRDAANILDWDCKVSKGEWVLESESVVERRGDGEQANGDGEGDVEEGGREQCRRGRAVYGLPRRTPQLGTEPPLIALISLGNPPPP